MFKIFISLQVFCYCRFAVSFSLPKPLVKQTTERDNKIAEGLVCSFYFEGFAISMKVLLSGKLIHILFWELPYLRIPFIPSIFIFSDKL